MSFQRRSILAACLVILFSLIIVLSPANSAIAAGKAERYIVVFRDDVDADATADSLTNAHGLGREFVYTHALRGMSAVIPANKLDAVRNDPRVAYVEVDQKVQIAAQTIPTGVGRMFATSNSNLRIDSVDQRVDVDVAVIDTGVDYTHPDLNVVNRVDCAGGSPNKRSCAAGGTDGNGHGTHVAGTIGALDNGIGSVGVAAGARIWSVRVLNNQGSGYASWILAGIDYVAANSASIEVANMSLGGQGSGTYNSAIANAISRGVVFVVAAGNDDANASSFQPANVADVITVSALADFNGLPGGGAASTCRVDQDDTLADFSNWGSSVEIAAPGVCIYSTWKGGGYNTISGTSMASPNVAGAAALLASRTNPANRTDVLNISQTLRNAGNTNWTDDSGDGVKEPLLDVSNSSTFNPVFVP
jgi:subtilisin